MLQAEPNETTSAQRKATMNWKDIPYRLFVGGYVDLLNEGRPNVPNDSGASVTKYLRGRIKFISSLHHLPAFHIGGVKKFDKHLHRWKNFITKPKFILKLSDFNRHHGLLNPVQLNKGTLLMNTLNGITALIYPSGTKPPKRSPFAKSGKKEIIDLLKEKRN
jgi:hypothetical protein